MSWPTAPWLVWDLAGRPDHGKRHVTHHGPCYVCGHPCPGDAVTTKDAIGVNFDHTRAGRRDSLHVCAPCAWAMSGKPPHTLRMWSGAAAPTLTMPPNHPKCALTTPPQVHLTNRADLTTIAGLLTNPPDGPWTAWIALTGQKHVVPYSPLNHGAGRWAVQVEDSKATATPSEFALVLARVIRLRRAGFPEAAILTGNPGTWMDRPERLTAWTTHGRPLTALADSPLLKLACLIPTKGTIDALDDTYGHLAPTPEPDDDRPGPRPHSRALPGPDDELRLF